MKFFAIFYIVWSTGTGDIVEDTMIEPYDSMKECLMLDPVSLMDMTNADIEKTDSSWRVLNINITCIEEIVV